jgi:hypothetical protein
MMCFYMGVIAPTTFAGLFFAPLERLNQAKRFTHSMHTDYPPMANKRTTVSGYPIRDAYKALDAAVAARDAEKACCLAAELAATQGEPPALSAHLVDAYASWYASVDVRALERVARALGDFMSGGMLTREGRRGLCVAVVAMAVGLPRQDASAKVACDRAANDEEGAAEGGRGTGTTTASACAVRLSDLLRRGKTARAARLAHRMLAESSARAGPAGALPACAVWDACLDAVSGAPGAEREFVRSAHALYHGRAPPVPPSAGDPAAPPPMSKAVRGRRANLALCSALVASCTGRPGLAASLPSTWAGAKADAAAERACELIDTVFEDIASRSGAAGQPPPLQVEAGVPTETKTKRAPLNYDPSVPQGPTLEKPWPWPTPDGDAVGWSPWEEKGAWKSPWDAERQRQQRQLQQPQPENGPKVQKDGCASSRGPNEATKGDVEDAAALHRHHHYNPQRPPDALPPPPAIPEPPSTLSTHAPTSHPASVQSYLQLYTTIDHADVARADDARHEAHLDAMDEAAPRTIRLMNGLRRGAKGGVSGVSPTPPRPRR